MSKVTPVYGSLHVYSWTYSFSVPFDHAHGPSLGRLTMINRPAAVKKTHMRVVGEFALESLKRALDSAILMRMNVKISPMSLYMGFSLI